jgi:pimeloyl-ACP methyl ester carboxylesterase
LRGRSLLLNKIMKIKIILFLILTIPSYAQLTKIDSGNIDGANYKIVFPENWSRKLLLFAHGYEFMGAPKFTSRPDFQNRIKIYLDRGFAVAASDYKNQGFALSQGVDDMEALRSHFYKKYGTPDSTFLVGQSMGGGVAIAIMENFGDYYHGAMPTCPLASRPFIQNRREFDKYAIFNGMMPGLLSSLNDIFDLSKPYKAQDSRALPGKAADLKKKILAKDSLFAIAFAKNFLINIDDLPMSFFHNENVLRDIAQKAGGNPFDNTNTIYSGFPNDLLVNQKAERLEATVNSNAFVGKYDRTGNISKPMLLVHTLYDQLIPAQYAENNIENMILKHDKGKYFTVKYTDGQGHCQFTAKQLAQAFDELRKWVNSGQKAPAGFLK